MCGEVVSTQKCVLVNQDGMILHLEQNFFQVPTVNRDVSALQPLNLVYSVSCCAVNPAPLVTHWPKGANKGCPIAQAEMWSGLLSSAQLSRP